jgi:hypothetical protein
MFAVELKFELGAPGKAEDQLDAITWLTAALVRNGNLLEEFLVRSDSNGWTVYGIIPARDAFHPDALEQSRSAANECTPVR